MKTFLSIALILFFVTPVTARSKHIVEIKNFSFSPTSLTIMAATNIEENEASVTKGFILSQNYPNPFNPATKIKLNLKKSDFVTLTIYNIAGQKIKTIVSGYKFSGLHNAIWDGTDESE